MKIKSISRCMVLVMALFFIAMTIPGLVYAQSHGITIQKSCSGPVAICDTNADCNDGNECTIDICNTNGLSQSLDCLITLTHADGFGDTLTVASIADVISASPSNVNSPNIVIHSVSGNTTCAVNGTLPCNLGPNTGAGAGSVVFRSFGYNPDDDDPNPLPNQATAIIVDNCNAPGTLNCSTTPNPVSFGASTLLQTACTYQSVAASTPCTDTDGNECTTAGCNGQGLCNQNHIFVPSSTPCSDTDQNLCTTAGCDGAGSCNQNHVVKPCTTNECNTGQCNPATGLCVPVATSTPCGDTDGNVCTQAGCVADGEIGTCNQNHIFTPASTTCPDTDGNECTTAGCNGQGLCNQNHIFVPASTPCSDTDSIECTTAGCDGAGVCNQRHIEECEAETCRTPGFWATHAGTEKLRSKNITQRVITDAEGCIEICGEIIDDTTLNSPDSAVEAMCVRVQGNSRLQLVRQLTAAALNCVVSGGGSDCTGISIEDVFQECNSTCATPRSPAGSLTINQCIFKLDCFNNGGQVIAINGTPYCQTGTCSDNQAPCKEKDLSRCGAPLTATCTPLEGNCKDRLLGMCKDGSICTEENTYIDANEQARCNDNSLCVPGPAGSSTKCNAANANLCTVVGSGEASCGTGDKTNPGLEYCD